jgi:integrase
LPDRLDTAKQRLLLVDLTNHGQARGWKPSTLLRARRALTALLTSDLDIGAAAAAADPVVVRRFFHDRHLVALRVVEFLTDRNLLRGDHDAAFECWLTGRLQRLPTSFCTEVTIWVEALRGRRQRSGRPRQASTIQGYLRAIAPALTDWAQRYQSLRQVTSDDVAAQLAPLTGATRLLTLTAMRSLFKTLKTQRMVFVNPTAGTVGRQTPPTPAMPLDPHIRAGLLSRLDQPEQRLILLLAGVHALRSAEICALRLADADLTKQTLLVHGHARPLDRLTGDHLRHWLETRRLRWPATANPYLLVNRSTAGGVGPVRRSFIHATFQRLNLSAHDLRVDRFLDEVHSTAGDPLRLTQLFAISDASAIRYCAELGLLDHELPGQQGAEPAHQFPEPRHNQAPNSPQ